MLLAKAGGSATMSLNDFEAYTASALLSRVSYLAPVTAKLTTGMELNDLRALLEFKGQKFFNEAVSSGNLQAD